MRDRANAMQTVEQTILELGGMFQQLATMIKEQDEAIQRIDSNIDDVDVNVNVLVGVTVDAKLHVHVSGRACGCECGCSCGSCFCC